ncbi:unnamed protein product [Paramecium sonneborni]|uniref:Uncharacterized protein n=1 Tax=Paramecium sonneborni TaxID=65129 RepID=A0A8S1QIX9_9CILI|nr:unnamed protein product [Paramecium sonneborni]
MYNPKIKLEDKRKVKSFNEKLARPIIICYDLKTKLPIQLKQVQYTVNIQPGLAIVQICQSYSTEQNQNQCDLEYLYTIQENSAVSQMIVELGDKKVYGVIKELEEAKKEYEKGIKEGKTMVLSEQDSKISNIKKVKIGCLNPGQQLKILFEYIQPIQVFLNQFWRLELSPMIDTSYLTVHQLQNVYQEYAFYYSQVSGIINLEAIQLNYQQNISVIIDMGKPITYINSPTHIVMINKDINNLNQKQNNIQTSQSQLTITLDSNHPGNMDPNKKFELLFTSDDINKSNAILSHTNNDALQHIKYCATLTLIPKFNEFPIEDAYQSYLSGLNLPQQTNIQRGTYLFFIDRSASMRGERIKKAKQSLILFLKSLPEDSLFNIISFGSNAVKMFDTSQSYNQNSLNQAIQQIEIMNANLGGTNIYKALEMGIYDQNYSKNQNNLETINAFLLTDGEDSPDQIIKLVLQNQRPETRVYTLGIGDGCSEYLVQKLAEVGNGKCQLVGDNEDINSKVIDLLEDSLTLYLKGFSLTHNIEKVSQIIPDPQSISLLKKNQELTIQILFSKKQKQENLEFKINCYDPQLNKQISFDVKLNLNQSKENDYFHKLAAHKLIKYYENAIQYDDQIIDKVKVNQKSITEQDIINLSLQNQILCSRTAFICEVCQNEKDLKKLIKKKIKINKQKYEYESDSSPDSQIKNQKGGIKYSRKQCILSNIQKCEKSSMPIQCQEIEQSEKVMLQSQSDNELEQQIIQTPFIQQNQQQTNKFLPKQSIQCILEPKILDNDFEMITFVELVDCFQANGSFLLEIHIEEQLKVCQINNKFNLEDQCWQTLLSLFYLEIFCQNSKNSWQLIYNKAINYLQKQGINYLLMKKEFIQEYKQLFENGKLLN